MTNAGYKYKPCDFAGIPILPQELEVMYRLVESYKKDRTEDNWFGLRKHWKDLFFTIKHREVEGFLNPVAASDLREYLDELIYDNK